MCLVTRYYDHDRLAILHSIEPSHIPKGDTKIWLSFLRFSPRAKKIRLACETTAVLTELSRVSTSRQRKMYIADVVVRTDEAGKYGLADVVYIYYNYIYIAVADLGVPARVCLLMLHPTCIHQIKRHQRTMRKRYQLIEVQKVELGN